MKIVTDLHSHSRYSRAVSQQMVLPVIAKWCSLKGIDVVATADWTHPVWFKELQNQLDEEGEGVYRLKARGPVFPSSHPMSPSAYGETAGARWGSPGSLHPSTFFLLSTEVAAIYTQGGKQRRIHMLIFAPNFAVAAKINQELTRLRMNLFSDGRPILGMSAKDVLKIALEADERTLVIPAHIWTPWFSLYGSMSGFDSIEECFGDLSKYIYGIETGLSSDPAMNWRISDLNNRAILSFSDAHSPAKLGRELTVFEVPDGEVNYEAIKRAIMQELVDSNQYSAIGNRLQVTNYRLPTTEYRIAYTIEFYPEEGKYHYTGHRNCGVRHSPEDTKKLGTKCPNCKRELTIGVMHRVDQLADPQTPTSNYKTQNGGTGVKWLKHQNLSRPPYIMMVPLLEILAEAMGSAFGSKKTQTEYEKLTGVFENEMTVLLKTPVEEITLVSGSRIADAIRRVRAGDIIVDPGYDGVFGTVKIWQEEKKKEVEGVEQSAEGSDKKKNDTEQIGLF